MTLQHHDEISSEKLIAAIRRARRVPLHRFLLAIGLPNVGPATARLLGSRFGTLARLRAASREDLAGTEGLSERTAELIYAALREPRTRALIEGLLLSGVIIESGGESGAGTLAGKRFVFTGELGHVTRREAVELIASLGGVTQSRVNDATDYVVVGEAPGDKLDEAKRRYVPELSERAFLDLIRRAARDEEPSHR